MSVNLYCEKKTMEQIVRYLMVGIVGGSIVALTGLVIVSFMLALAV